MKRKVVKQGACTLMISLPTKWAKRFNITKGDELEVKDQGKILLITTQKEHSIEKTSVDVTELNPMILRTLAAMYKAGYDEIKVTFEEPKMLGEVQKAISKEISGYEIVEQSKKHCIIKNIEGGLEEGFEPSLRRIFLLLNAMAEDSLEAIKKRKYEELTNIRFLEESNNRFTTFCRRVLSKKGYKEHNKIQFVYYIVEQLERVADQYKYLFDYLMKKENKKLKLSKEVIQKYQETNEFVKTFYELFYKFDKEKVVKLGRMRKKLVNELLKLFEEKNSKESMIIHHLLTIIQLTFGMLGPYLSLNL